MTRALVQWRERALAGKEDLRTENPANDRVTVCACDHYTRGTLPYSLDLESSTIQFLWQDL
jgi:hypothetical protein